MFSRIRFCGRQIDETVVPEEAGDKSAKSDCVSDSAIVSAAECPMPARLQYRGAAAADQRRRIEAQEKTVEQAQRGYDIASTRFVNGLGTQLEVNDAQVALTQARVNRIQAYYDYVIASVDLNETLGILPEYVSSTLVE